MIKIVLLMSGLVGISAPVLADSSEQIHDLAVLTDPEGLETIASVITPSRAADFIPMPRGFSAGYTRDVHWLRFTLYPPALDAQGVRESLLVIYPSFLDDVRLYLPSATQPNRFELRRSGDRLPFTERDYPYRSFAHAVTFDDDQPLTVYVRLETTSSAWVVIRVWTPEQFLNTVTRETLILGLFFGLLLAGIMANLWHGLWRNQALYRSFLLYLLVSFGMLFAVNGFVAQWVFPNSPVWNDHFTSVSNLLLMAAMTRFFTHALKIHDGSLGLRGLYHGTVVLALLAVPTPFLDLYPEAMKVLVMAMLLILVLGTGRSLQLWWRGESPAGLLFLAHAFSLLGAFPTALLLGGWLSGYLLLHYGFQIGMLGSLAALQIMLALRVRHIEHSQMELRLLAEQAQTKAHIEHHHLEQQRRLMSMLTHELKTPLSVIALCLKAAQPSARMQRLAQQAVADILAIIDRCALSARVEDQALRIELTDCDLCQMLSELRDTWPGAERLQGLTISEPCGLRTDPRLVRMVLSNLIDNALKYSPPGTPVTVALAAQHWDGVPGWQVTLSNSVVVGQPFDINRLFEKYYRGTGAQRVSGSGLGLYVVHEVVQRLQGRVRFSGLSDAVRCELWLPINMT